VLKDVLAGYNGSILAYGQTGAGKTHSLLNAGMVGGSLRSSTRSTVNLLLLLLLLLLLRKLRASVELSP
jgi:hypothetical protein